MEYIHGFDFSITSFCQAKCRSCVRTEQDTGDIVSWLTPSHMPIEVYKKILSTSKSTLKTTKEIQFCGELGDPMMHPDIEQFIDTSLEYVDRISINTNGGLRQPKWYKHAVEKYGEKLYIEWGIDGMDHETNDMYRENVNWQRAMDNMAAWFENGGKGQWDFLIFDWNWHHIPEAIEHSRKLDCKIYLKFNNRGYGLISDENKKIAVRLLEEYNVL